MKSILINTNGDLKVIDIRPDGEKIREILGGPVDTIRLFSNAVTYIKRFPEETDKFNKKIHGVKGSVLITGGHGSYFSDLTEKQISDISLIFNGVMAYG